MSARKRVAIGAGALALVLALSGHADAAVISSMPNKALTATPFVVTFGSGTASFSFTAVTAAVTGNGPGAAVATSGTGKAGTFFGSLADFEAGSTIDQTGELYNFAAYATPTLIPNSPSDDFIGLSFTLADGVHYGYAEVNGAQLVSDGYETTANASILTGATRSVPEPASLTLLAAGCLGLIGARARRR